MIVGLRQITKGRWGTGRCSQSAGIHRFAQDDKELKVRRGSKPPQGLMEENMGYAGCRPAGRLCCWVLIAGMVCGLRLVA